MTCRDDPLGGQAVWSDGRVVMTGNSSRGIRPRQLLQRGCGTQASLVPIGI